MAGCMQAAKVVAWDEQVALNSGETIEVHREQTYESRGQPGNPLKPGWISKRWGTARLTWREREYVFNEHSAPMLLAISPEGLPVFLIDPGIGAWSDLNNHPCSTPYYVQFVPDASGRRWTRLNTPEPWLYGLRTNLLMELPRPGSAATRYTAADVRRIHESVNLRPENQIVDPTYTPDHCKGKRTAS